MAHQRKTVAQAQQELAKNCGYEENIIWDLTSSEEAEIMKNKIEHLIPAQGKGQNSILEMRKNMFNSVWKQRIYTNKMSVSYIFYVMVTKEKIGALQSTEYSCHPVFRCKKCDKNSVTSDCCMIYVDEVGRIYQNWESYLNENILPPGTMIAPHKGIYKFDRGQVILTVCCTPNGKPTPRAMSELQQKSAVVGMGAAGVSIAALAFPIAAPIMAVTGIIGLGVGAFTAVTSAVHLNDRGKHGQSVSLGSREARRCYLGLLGGTVGIAAAGTTRVMASMASAGKATKGIEVLVNGMNISSLAISGSGVVNGVFDLIFSGDEISSMDIVLLSASLVLFTHSIHNFRLASEIANNARNKSISSYRETLSNRQRKMFDKMSKETLRIRGGTQGKMDIIRGVNEIPDRQFLNDLFKINQKLNKQNVRPSFGPSGKGVVLNNEVAVNTAELRQSVQHQRGPDILEQVTQPIPSTYNSDTYNTQTPKEVKLFFADGDDSNRLDAAVNANNWETKLIKLAVELKHGATIMLNNFGEVFLRSISDFSTFQDVILCLFDNFSKDTAIFICKLAQTFIEQFKQTIEQKIKMVISTESVLYRIFKYVLDNYTDLSYIFISQKSIYIMETIKTYFSRMNYSDSEGREMVCPDCFGTITLSKL